MPTYYVGPGGNNANSGTTWALRKLTLNGAEDIPVAAGDTVYVGAGVYRETLTVDVSGSAGSPITYIGDYTGANTDGVGGVVRITGSDNDITATRTNCIVAVDKTHRVFTGLDMGFCSQHVMALTSPITWTIQQCSLQPQVNAWSGIYISGASQAGVTIRNCVFPISAFQPYPVQFAHSSTIDDTGHVIENCLIYGYSRGVAVLRVGGVTMRNTLVVGSSLGVRVEVALSAGQTITVNNCIFAGCVTTFQATAVGEIVENYNTLWASQTPRSNTNTGANSNTYPPLFDTRWFFEAVNGGDMVTPFDLASYSQLINVAGTSPTTTDMRGTAVIGGVREWGALEYDSTLDIKAGAGGAVGIFPVRGVVGL